MSKNKTASVKVVNKCNENIHSVFVLYKSAQKNHAEYRPEIILEPEASSDSFNVQFRKGFVDWWVVGFSVGSQSYLTDPKNGRAFIDKLPVNAAKLGVTLTGTFLSDALVGAGAIVTVAAAPLAPVAGALLVAAKYELVVATAAANLLIEQWGMTLGDTSGCKRHDLRSDDELDVINSSKVMEIQLHSDKVVFRSNNGRESTCKNLAETDLLSYVNQVAELAESLAEPA